MTTPQPFPAVTHRSPGNLDAENAALRREVQALRAQRVPDFAPLSARLAQTSIRVVKTVAESKATPWVVILGSIAALVTAITPTLLATIDVARVRADVAILAAARPAEAEALQSYKARVQTWQDQSDARALKLEAELKRLSEELERERAVKPKGKRVQPRGE